MEKTVLYTEPERKPAKLLVFRQGRQPEEMFLGERAILGRESGEDSPVICIASPIVSRRHGEFASLHGEYFYRDLNSDNGTCVNGKVYGKNAKLPSLKLENGDVLRIDQSSEDTIYPDAVVMVFLTAYAENVRWTSQPLSDNIEEVSVGRGSNQNLSIKDQAVSKNHASFSRTGRGWQATDHNSTNGVYVNNRKISNPVGLRAGDVVRIADTLFIYWGDHIVYSGMSPATSGGSQLMIRIAERSLWQRFKKITILQDINLTVHPGEMVMILGGSGAGKTTFMNAVMGYEKADGQIMHGNIDVYKEYEQIKYEIGFVPQQDLLRFGDNVFDTLSNAAKMKMPRRTDPEERHRRVEEVLELLGLQRERGSLVSKLSGGQRKRLSIAVEMVSDPSLFFLDEPDSGLDGIMAKSIHEKLRVIADTGKIVMTITHGPDRVIHLYEKVIVLAKSIRDNCGHLAYYGSPGDAKAFFDTDSMEGIIRRINRPDEGGDGKSDYYIEKYKKQIGG